MARKRRSFSPFGLSFLDIMSCGFGATVLLFLIIKHSIDTHTPSPFPTVNLTSEVSTLEEEIQDEQKNLVQVRNTISEIDQKLVEAQGRAERITEEIDSTEGLTDELTEDANVGKLEKLKADIKALELKRQQLTKELGESGEASRKFAGDGDRAYVTGLKLGGKRVLILLDVSASMLDDKIVNILRRRNMRDERQRTAPKWTRSLRTIEWLIAKYPQDTRYQIYAFNDKTEPVLPDTRGQWLELRDKVKLEQVIDALYQYVPKNGTNLENALAAAGDLRPLPDNIFLITDGLPTQGAKSSRNATITGRERLKLFGDAIEKLPGGIPVNVILAPLEGDPIAANAYWQLSQRTQGSFMSPSEDWP